MRLTVTLAWRRATGSGAAQGESGCVGQRSRALAAGGRLGLRSSLPTRRMTSRSSNVHVRLLLPPLLTVVGDADNVTVGAGGGFVTETEALAWAVPPAPVQLSVKDVLAFNAPVLCVPAVALVPLQPPDAVHDVAFVELHVKVLLPPLLTVVGDADNVTVGAGVALVTETEALGLSCAAGTGATECERWIGVQCTGALGAGGRLASRSSLPTRCMTSRS